MDEKQLKQRRKYQGDCLKYASKKGLLNYKELGVYCFINLYFNCEKNYSFPSHEHIREQLNISEPTLLKILNSLESKGFIKRKRGKTGWNTQYYLTLPTKQTEQIIPTKEFNNIEETTETIETYDDYDWEQIQEMRKLGLIK